MYTIHLIIVGLFVFLSIITAEGTENRTFVSFYADVSSLYLNLSKCQLLKASCHSRAANLCAVGPHTVGNMLTFHPHPRRLQEPHLPMSEPTWSGAMTTSIASSRTSTRWSRRPSSSASASSCSSSACWDAAPRSASPKSASALWVFVRQEVQSVTWAAPLCSHIFRFFSSRQMDLHYFACLSRSVYC